MTVLYVFLGLVLLLFLISLIRVGVRLEYAESGLCVEIKLGAFFLRVFPLKAKKKKEKKAKPQKEKKADQPKEKKGGTFELVKQCLPLAAEAAGELKRKIIVDRLYLDLLWSVSDPAACALGFGGANAAVGMLWPALEQNFHIKEHRIRTAVDFELGRPTVYLLAQMTMRIGQLLSWSLRMALRFFKIYRNVQQKETNSHTTQQKEAI